MILFLWVFYDPTKARLIRDSKKKTGCGLWLIIVTKPSSKCLLASLLPPWLLVFLTRSDTQLFGNFSTPAHEIWLPKLNMAVWLNIVRQCVLMRRKRGTLPFTGPTSCNIAINIIILILLIIVVHTAAVYVRARLLVKWTSNWLRTIDLLPSVCVCRCYLAKNFFMTCCFCGKFLFLHFKNWNLLVKNLLISPRRKSRLSAQL